MTHEHLHAVLVTCFQTAWTLAHVRYIAMVVGYLDLADEQSRRR